MTAPDNQDPWGSLADSLGLPAGSDAEKSGETAASTPPAAPPPASKPAKPEPVRRDPKPAAPADWGALASDFGLEPEPEPAAKPQPAKPAAAETPHAPVEARASDERGPAQGHSEQRRERPAAPSQPAKRADQDDIAQKLATGSRLWDDEPAAAPAKPAPSRAARPEPEPAPEPDEPAPSFAGPDFMEREVRKAREPLAADDGDEAQADRPAADADADGDEDRPRRRRRGRRGGRGRSRARRDEESRDHDDADASVRESDAGDEELADRFDEDREAAQGDRDEEGERADDESREEPRRGRSRRGRGRRSRRGSDAEGSRRPSRDEQGEDHLDDREPRGEDDDLTDAVGEAVESSEDAVGEDGEPRKKRRRRGRRGGRRRSKTREGEGASDEADDDSSDDSTPTGYVGAAKPGKAEGGRRKEAEGEKSGDERRRRRRRGRGSSSDEKSGARGRGRPAFRPVSSSFSQDDEGLEYLGLDDAEDGDAHLPARRSDADTDEAVAESGLDAVREVPSWVEAIGIVIASNLDARAKSPRQDNGRSSRGRSGR